MLFLSCGFISQDNLIPCRMLAWAQSLKDKPLKAKSLEFRHSKGHVWVTEGVNLIHKAQWETWECQTTSFIIHVPRWPLSELKGSFWRCLWPIQIELLFVCLGVFFCKGVYFPANYKDGSICKYWSNWTLEDGTLGSLWHDFLLSISRLCLVKAKRGQLQFCAFLAVFWPWFSICSLAFHGGTEAHFPGDITREGSPLWLWLEGLEPAMGQRPKRAGWKVNSQGVTLLRGKKTFIPLSSACWLMGSLIVLVNNLPRHWLFSRVKLCREVRETNGHASHLPALQDDRRHFLSCFIR